MKKRLSLNAFLVFSAKAAEQAPLYKSLVFLVSILNALQSNFQYTSVVIVNNIFIKLGLDIGGYFDNGTIGEKD